MSVIKHQNCHGKGEDSHDNPPGVPFGLSLSSIDFLSGHMYPPAQTLRNFRMVIKLPKTPTMRPMPPKTANRGRASWSK